MGQMTPVYFFSLFQLSEYLAPSWAIAATFFVGCGLLGWNALALFL